MAKELKTRIVLRNDSTLNWTTQDPVLMKGEIGFDMDLLIFKVGDGVKKWSELTKQYKSYEDTMEAVNAAIQEAVEGLHATAVFQADTVLGGDKIAALNAVATNPAQGDIGIVRETLSPSGKHQYTGYVYTGTEWAAMDGNYDAENVYFQKDLTITAPIGVQTIPSTGSKTLETTGKNVKQVFDMLCAEEKDPVVTQPSVSVSLTGAGAKEVGTSVTPAYTVSFNKGKYSYGPDTGITATYAVTDTAGGSATAATGTFTQFTVAENTNYKISVTASYGAGVAPVTNLGNEKADLAIAAGTKSATSSAITGYRGWFQGYYNGTDAITDASAITSAQLRTFGVKNGNFSTPMTTTQMKQMFFAAPKGVVKSVGVANAVNGAPQTVTKALVNVEGANGYAAAEYDLFYVSNAVAESGDSKWNITVTK